MMKVTIGITSYNRLEMLRESLNSCINQTYPNLEILVGNDYPLKEVTFFSLGIPKDNRVQIINHPKNLGEMTNLNFLLQKATGKYFIWLADDDLFHTQMIEEAISLFSRFTHLQVVFPKCLSAQDLPNETKKKVKTKIYSGDSFITDYLNKEISLQGVYGIFKTDFLRKLGGIKKMGVGYGPYSDFLIALKTGLSENEIGYIDTPLILFRVHEESLSATSSDSLAFFTAQKDLLASLQDYQEEKKIKYRKEMIATILFKWFIPDFGNILIRNTSFSFFYWMRYSIFIGKILLKWHLFFNPSIHKAYFLQMYLIGRKLISRMTRKKATE